MNCPYCDFHFGAILSPVEVNKLRYEDIIPAICERCSNISVLVPSLGRLLRLDNEQLEILKTSPAWQEHIKPAYDIIIKGTEYLNWKKSHV